VSGLSSNENSFFKVDLITLGLDFSLILQRTKLVRQSLQNRLLFMRSITFAWNSVDRKPTNDEIRVQMKRFFFPAVLYETVSQNQKTVQINQSEAYTDPDSRP